MSDENPYSPFQLDQTEMDGRKLSIISGPGLCTEGETWDIGVAELVIASYKAVFEAGLRAR